MQDAERSEWSFHSQGRIRTTVPRKRHREDAALTRIHYRVFLAMAVHARLQRGRCRFVFIPSGPAMHCTHGVITRRSFGWPNRAALA